MEGFNLEIWFLALIVLASSAIFYVTSKDDRCWYRRYIFPGLFLIFAMFSTDNLYISIIFILSSLLAFFGYKGYGQRLNQNIIADTNNEISDSEQINTENSEEVKE